MSEEPKPGFIATELIKVREKYPETFRKTLAYYVAARVEGDPSTPQWREKVFDTVDMLLMGIEHSDYQLVARA